MAGYVSKVELTNEKRSYSVYDVIMDSDLLSDMITKLIDTVVWNAENNGVYCIEFPNKLYLYITLTDNVTHAFGSAESSNVFRDEVLSGVSLAFMGKFNNISEYINDYLKKENLQNDKTVEQNTEVGVI